MFCKNQSSILMTLWLWPLFGFFYIYANCQSENAIGAHRAFEKTSFSCAGRPAGYYADIETGCQVYHMCDGLGRQFSYSCPNTTLFQQRMLICDHWYMVNCSKAESHYAANLLIGQRDKPFVNDEENNLRTPRPDLLDRPYAPDYSGESFRHQYKQLPASQNRITDRDTSKTADKLAQASQPSYGQQKWKIPPPSRTIQPPAYEPQIETKSTKAFSSAGTTTTSRFASRYTTQRPIPSTTTTKTTTTTRRIATTYNNAPLHQRQRNSHVVVDDDLGTSHSTRYNTSADFNSAEVSRGKPIRKPNTITTAFTSTASARQTTTTTTKSPSIKVPSKIYEPPFLYPIYNENDTAALHTSTERPLRVSTATPFTARRTTTTTTTATPYTSRPPSRPTTLAGKPFTASPFAATSTAVPNGSRNQNKLAQASYNRFDFTKFEKDGRTPTPAQGFKAPTPLPPLNSAKTLKPAIGDSALDYKTPKDKRLELPAKPSNDLLPPFADFVEHDVATTQGPPIYYEWKVPSNGLEPPKLDPPIGVDGREYPETVIDYNSINAAGGFGNDQSFGIDQGSSSKASYAFSNPFLKAASTSSPTTTTTRTPASRSIKETAQPNSVSYGATSKFPPSANSSPELAAAALALNTDITELRKELSVPEYSFPLENIGRTGYLDTNTYNSFQLKIPERRIDTEQKKHWFGENPKCPECHPSYVKPGTCEPCLRR